MLDAGAGAEAEAGSGPRAETGAEDGAGSGPGVTENVCSFGVCFGCRKKSLSSNAPACQNVDFPHHREKS